MTAEVPTCPTCQRKHTPEQGCLDGVVLGCGGRNYTSWTRVCAVMDQLHARMVIRAVRHGGARGADALVHRWALSRKVPTDPMRADWKRYGQHRAGPIRNSEMAAKEPIPVVGVAFPGGNGTRDMVGKLEKAGIKVWRVDWS
jgi:hypothetical protein